MLLEITMTEDVKLAIRERMENIKKIAQSGEMTRQKLDEIQAILREMASHESWWSEDKFPAPEQGELQARYMIYEEPDHTYALYLNVMRPGKKIVPHNHTTWACIAAVQGTEFNYVYERTAPKASTLRQIETVEVSPGKSIGLLADDIHAVQIQGDQVIRHLHLYGRALETLTEREAFDLETGTSKIMDIGVKTRR